MIANTREIAVLSTVKTESGMVKFKETEKGLALEKELVDLPRLTSLLHRFVIDLEFGIISLFCYHSKDKWLLFSISISECFQYSSQFT